MSSYTDEQLIELIRERSPQELSEDEISELRREMRRSPQVREALAAEVGLEQAIAVHLAPEAAAGDEFVSRLDQMLAERRRGWMMRVYGAVVVAVFVIGAFATSPYWMPQPDSPPPPTLAGPSEVDPSGAQLDTPPEAAASAEVDPRGRAADAPPTGAEAADDPIALDWRHYVDPITVPGLWADDFAAGLKPIDKARWEPKEHRGQNWVELEGSYRLTALPTPGRMVRLVFDARQALRIDAWSGRDGVRLRWDGKETWTRHPITRAKAQQTEPDKPAEEVEPEPLGPISRASVLPLDLGVKGEALTLSSADVLHAQIALPGDLTDLIVGYRGRLYLAQPRPAVVLPVSREVPLTSNGPVAVERDAAGGDQDKDDEAARLQASLRDYELSIIEAKRGNLAEALRLLRRPDARGAGRDDFLRDHLTRASRLTWYRLAAAGDWELLREDVLRRRAWSIREQGTLPDDAKDAPLLTLGEWMLARALAATGDQLPGFAPTYFTHPLNVRADRETESLLAEFDAAVGAQQPAQAARLLVAAPLADTLVAVGSDPDLLRLSHLLVRQTLRQTPQLRSIIRSEHEAVGRVRVGRAMAQDDVELLEALALQFYGSEPGITAAGYLADRDLSLGKFLAAAERYQSLLDLPEPPDAELLNAKYRLAWAMMGEVQGQPVTRDVQIGEHRYRPSDFEALIRELAAANGVSAAPSDRRDDAAKRLKPGDLRLVHRATVGTPIEFGREHRLRLVTGPRRAAVIGSDALYVFDYASGQTHRFSDDPPKNKDRGEWDHDCRPVLLEDGMVAGWRRGDRLQLRRVTLDGQTRWTTTPDRGVLGDPVRLGRWLYVLSAADDLGGRTQVNLNRIDLENGEIVHTRRLMALAPTAGQRHIARGLATPRGPVWVLASNLIATDTTGEVRWVRRLPFVPPQVDAALWPDDRKPSLATDGERIVVVTPGSPSVDAVEADTGRLLWRSTLSEAQRVLDVSEGVAVIAEKSTLTRLDANDGGLRGTLTLPPNQPTAITRQDDLLLLTQPPAEENQPPTLRWMDAATGEPRHTTNLPPAAAYLDLALAGDHLLAITLDDKRQPVIMLFK